MAQKFMQTPVHSKEEEGVVPVECIHQRAIEVNRNNRGPLLRYLIKTEQWGQALIFVSSIRDADILAAKLLNAGIEANAFHGALTQTQRSEVLNNFKIKNFMVLVVTDIAVRGIDIDKVSCVVNYDLPRSPDGYTHRIAMAAGAGKRGVAVTFVGHEDQTHFSLIEKRAHLRLPRESVKGFELIGEPLPKEKGKVPVKGYRMSKKDKARALALKEGEQRERIK